MSTAMIIRRSGVRAVLCASGAGLLAGFGLGWSSTSAADAPAKYALTFDSKAAKLTGFPATLKGGHSTFTLTGGAYPVNLALAQVTGTRTDAEITKSVNSGEGPPSWAVLYGGTGGGARAGVTRTGTVNLDKGNYIWIVFSGGEELEGKSPWGRFTVSGAKSSTAPRGGTASVKTLEYGFQLSGLKAGKNTITYSNPGKEMHHVIMFKLGTGKTIADVKKAFASDGPPPDGLFDNAGQSSLPIVSSGIAQVADIELKKGTYAFVCFLADKTGKPHFASGMISEVKVA